MLKIMSNLPLYSALDSAFFSKSSKNSADSCIPLDLPGDPSWLLWYLYTFLWWCLGHNSSSHSHGAPWCLCLFEWHSVSNSCHTNDVIWIWNNALCSLTWGLASFVEQSFNFYNFRKCILVHNGRESLHITGKTTAKTAILTPIPPTIYPELKTQLSMRCCP